MIKNEGESGGGGQWSGVDTGGIWRRESEEYEIFSSYPSIE